MKKETREVYVCESCGRFFVNEFDHNEKACRARIKLERIGQEYYNKRYASETELAVGAAKESGVLRMLVKNGFTEEARIQAEAIHDSVSSWDCDSSIGIRGIIDKMIEAVKDGR